MKKKTKKKIFVGIIVLVIALLFFNFSGFFNVLDVSTKSFVQYTGIPVCSGSQCSWFTTNQLDSKNVEINTGENIFRFESSVESIQQKKVCHSLSEKKCSDSQLGSGVPTYVDSDGCQHWDYSYVSIKNWGYYRDPCGSPTSSQSSLDCFVSGTAGSCVTGDRYGGYKCGVCLSGRSAVEDFGGQYISTTSTDGTIFRGCYQEMNVYKNNVLIDTLNSEPSMGYNANTYYDEGVSGSGVRVDIQNSWFYASVCSAYQNVYVLTFPVESIIMNVSSPKEEYLEGEDIKVDVRVLNNLKLTATGTLKIEYETPTILGTKTSSSVKEVVINPGENIFQYSIPTTEPVRILKVRPSIIIYYPTTGISGVNYNFYTGEVIDINLGDKFQIGTIQEVWSEISIKSLASYYYEQLNLTQEQLNLLNSSLQEKLSLIEQYKDNLEIQTLIINELGNTLDEKITLVKSLQLNIDDQNTLISNLQLNLDEKTELVKSLSSNLDEQASIIFSLTSKADEQSIIISELGLTILQQGDLIDEMKLTVAQQSIVINNLNLNIQEQANIINNLNLNLQEKIELISRLEITTEEQQSLISQMNLSFADQQIIINALNRTISDDVFQINQLSLTISESAVYINLLELTVSQQSELVSQLKLTNLEQVALISQLGLNNEEMGNLISDLNLEISEQSDLIIMLNLELKDDAEIIKNLNLKLDEEADLIDALHLTIDEQIELISQLDLSLAEEQELVDLLNIEIIKQQEILNGLQEYRDTPAYIHFWDDYKAYIISISVLILLIIGGLFYKKKTK